MLNEYVITIYIYLSFAYVAFANANKFAFDPLSLY